jgi:hypothetical protein
MVFEIVSEAPVVLYGSAYYRLLRYKSLILNVETRHMF